MEPLAYAQIARRWWWLIAGLVVAALAIVYVTTPARFVDHYEATHVLLVEDTGDSSRNAAANPEVVALWAKETEVLERAAAAIGPAVNPERLGRDIAVRTNRNVGTVSITATDLDPSRAALKANTVAAETVAFLTEREAARQVQVEADLATQEQSLRERISALDAVIATNPPDVETQTAERDALIRQLGSVLEAQDAEASTVVYTTIDEADRGTKQDRLPGTRSRAERMALAAAVALVLGFGLALTLDRSDTRVRTRRSAEEHFGLPVIAEVVKFPFLSRWRKLVVVRQPDTAVAESYRTLRSALMLLEPELAPQWSADDPPPAGGGRAGRGEVIMITSPGSGDGKTTTVSNLAAAYGESGYSVLMLSFDLQRVRDRQRSRSGRAPGVTEYLAAETPIPLAALVTGTNVHGVRMVGIGNATRPPGGQLADQQRLIDEARALADIVLIDTAPLLASSINRELATMVDGVVALCRVGRTTVAQAERCGDLLAQIRAPAIGVVMTGVTAPEGSAYFAYWTLRRDRRSETTTLADGTAPAAPAPPDETVPTASPVRSAPPPRRPRPPIRPGGVDTIGPRQQTDNGHVRETTSRDVPVDDR
jgi:Mrp family chromosome partitioning ATPase/capsular polysaccharide biosynthesis protein